MKVSKSWLTFCLSFFYHITMAVLERNNVAPSFLLLSCKSSVSAKKIKIEQKIHKTYFTQQKIVSFQILKCSMWFAQTFTQTPHLWRQFMVYLCHTSMLQIGKLTISLRKGCIMRLLKSFKIHVLIKNKQKYYNQYQLKKYHVCNSFFVISDSHMTYQFDNLQLDCISKKRLQANINIQSENLTYKHLRRNNRNDNQADASGNYLNLNPSGRSGITKGL